MYINDVGECFDEITSYLKGDKTGHFLLVNTDAYFDYRGLVNKLNLMQKVKVLRASDYLLPNGLPDTDRALGAAADTGESVLIGLSQARMLESRTALKETVKSAVEYPIRGRSVLLLFQCGNILSDLLKDKPKFKNRILILNGKKSKLPLIKIAPDKMKPYLKDYIDGIPALLRELESAVVQTEKSELTIVSGVNAGIFKNSLYLITEIAGAYEEIVSKNAELSGFLKKSYAPDDFWFYLLSALEDKTFSQLITSKFGSVNNLSNLIGKERIRKDKNLRRLFWLGLKRYGDDTNLYLTQALKKSRNPEDIDERIYNTLLDFSPDDRDFDRMYNERKSLIKEIAGAEMEVYTDSLTRSYVDEAAMLLENEIFYLTDLSETETERFFRALSCFEYSNNEIKRAVKNMSEDLYKYLTPFSFDMSNVKISEKDSGILPELTEYFQRYKYQKLTNCVYPEFLEKVNKLAKETPRLYTKFPARNKTISDLDKENAFIYIIDALGLEYLGYIVKSAENSGLMCEINVARAEIPTITEFNTGVIFESFDKENYRKVDALDELKHCRNTFDYQKCDLPIHLPEELKIIDGVLLNARQKLNGGYQKVYITADHGSSRLAAICANEPDGMIELEEKGKHSGRCCKISEDPALEYAAYENGYAAIADYKRFKGGRKADLETHGGAALEEILVPVITLEKPRESIKFVLKDDEILLNPKSPIKLIVRATSRVKNLRLLLNGKFYEGINHDGEGKIYQFEIDGIKRKGTYNARLYSGDKDLCAAIEFKTKKKTVENDIL